MSNRGLDDWTGDLDESPRYAGRAEMATPWDARTYDRTSAPQQSWAEDVLARLGGLAPDATVLDIGCGTGRVTETLLELVPRGRVLAIDSSQEMVTLARERLGERAEVWCQSALDLDLREEVDVVVSTAALHWVPEHDRLWVALARALRPHGALEVQCGGAGNIARVRAAIAQAARAHAPELIGFSPWIFATPEETEQRLVKAGFGAIRCWLQERPTFPDELGEFVRTSILAAHIERSFPAHREALVRAVTEQVRPPLDYVRLNISAVRREPALAGHAVGDQRS
ncbi:MAG TPA: class I SAM-dependent methyltransferase [Solirubrobacteraceae bacterium]|nr:class I SAM-dependent methyltransferase [Solirubrobacteraceae bacterium]